MCDPVTAALVVGGTLSFVGGNTAAGGIDQQARGQDLSAKGIDKVAEAQDLSAKAQEQIALAQLEEGRALKRTSDFKSQVAKNNAILQRRNATDAVVRGKIASGERELETRQTISQQRVNAAARGVEVGTGSAARLNEDTAATGKLDSLRIVNNSEREAGVFNLLSDSFSSEAALQTLTGDNAITSSIIRARGTRIQADATRIEADATRFEADATRAGAKATRTRAKAERIKGVGNLLTSGGQIGAKFL